MSVFKRLTFFQFECCGERWYVTRFGKDFVEFEEVRKNGQEDVHMSGMAELSDGQWVIVEGVYNIEDQLGHTATPKLCQFFAEHAHELGSKPNE